MYLLYMDESGHHDAKTFVVAGIAVFERQTYWLSEEVDKIQQTILPDLPEPVAFHASAIRAGIDPPWSELTQTQRYQVLDEICRKVLESLSVMFAVAIEKQWAHSRGEDLYQFALESLIRRFDAFLTRRFRQEGERQRGLMVIASSEYQKVLEALALRVRRQGTRWGEIYNIAEVPLFTAAANSRMLQIADFCANAVFGRYETGHARHFDELVQKFDRDEGILHGLGHFCINYQGCFCPACLTRRMRAPLSGQSQVDLSDLASFPSPEP